MNSCRCVDSNDVALFRMKVKNEKSTFLVKEVDFSFGISSCVSKNVLKMLNTYFLTLAGFLASS